MFFLEYFMKVTYLNRKLFEYFTQFIRLNKTFLFVTRGFIITATGPSVPVTNLDSRATYKFQRHVSITGAAG